MLWTWGRIKRRQGRGVVACSLRLIGLADGGARTEKRRIPPGPINCRERAVALCLFRCLIGPSACGIGRARTWAETKYSCMVLTSVTPISSLPWLAS
uniref:Uncharacterized protein n=1 Tax=Ixodes ricinus TaxID=34613 RepID=A0A6B0U4K7_IXORI